MDCICLQNVSKKYNGKIILNNLNKNFSQGQSIAFVGHNGCGKSTLLKILAKLVAPTSGKVIYKKPLLFHYIPEKSFPLSLNSRQYLTHMGGLDGLEKNEIKSKIECFANDFFLTDLLDVPMKTLSKGTLQKVIVIQALLKTPDILLLDEPLSGQDSASQKVFIHKINQLREKNVTIFMSCHERQLVEAIAEKVYTIQNGSIIEYQYKTENMYFVILENANHLPLIDTMHKYGSYYSIKITQKECDIILPKLLQQGWKLRGLYNEKNN